MDPDRQHREKPVAVQYVFGIHFTVQYVFGIHFTVQHVFGIHFTVQKSRTEISFLYVKNIIQPIFLREPLLFKVLKLFRFWLLIVQTPEHKFSAAEILEKKIYFAPYKL